MLSKNKHSAQLAIILPGMGYGSQAPLLHFSAGVFISKGYDVLQVDYQYNNQDYEDFSEISDAIKLDVRHVTREVFKNAKAVWLTPLIQRDDVLNAMIESKNK